jgi:nucleoside-diphosphate-sugar epimerase
VRLTPHTTQFVEAGPAAGSVGLGRRASWQTKSDNERGGEPIMSSASEQFAVTPKPILVITGAAGLIGRRLCEKFRNDFRVVGLDVASSNGAAGIDSIAADLTKDESVEQAFDTIRQRYGDRVASVIHLAAYYDFAGEPSPLYDELTVRGTERLLRTLHEFHVEQFVFSSSLLVMEPSDDEALTEQSPTEAEWDYPRSKLEAEKVIESEHGNIPAVILRIAGVYDGLCHSIPISQQISRIYERKLESYLFPGDPDSGQAFVHLDDLTDCFRRVVDHRDRLDSYEVFIIAEPDVVTYAEMQELVGQMIHGEAWPAIRIPKVVAKVGAWAKNKLAGDDEPQFIKPWMIDLADDTYAVDIAHAKNTLDWHPDKRLRTTLSEIIDRLKSDPVGWYKANKLPVPEKLKTD